MHAQGRVFALHRHRDTRQRLHGRRQGEVRSVLALQETIPGVPAVDGVAGWAVTVGFRAEIPQALSRPHQALPACPDIVDR